MIGNKCRNKTMIIHSNIKVMRLDSAGLTAAKVDLTDQAAEARGDSANAVGAANG